MLTESNIIQSLKAHFPEQIGDDAACFPLNTIQNYVISKDLLVENTHFRLRYQNAESLAHKALHVNLSDIAAMGATPQFILLGLSIPPHFESQTADFLEAFSNACKAASVILIGGDTTRAHQELFLSITALGTASIDAIKCRKNTKPGNLLCIAGEIGAAHLGLTALEQEKPGFSDYKQAFLNPTARTKEGLWLGQQSSVSSMMDVSDGLLLDLERLCEASSVSCDVNLDALLPSPEYEHACGLLKLDPITTQISGGEDYSLMFSVTPEAYEPLLRQFKQHFKYDLKCIGQFKSNPPNQSNQSNPKISWLKNNIEIIPNIKPFLHFE